MNKQDWTYKKLGETCLIERGGSPRPIQQYLTDEDDGLNWIKIGDAVEGSKYITSTKEKIKPEGLKKTRFVHKGDFILSNSMSFGKPYILDIDGCIHDGWLVIRDNSDTFNKSFLYYMLSSPNMYQEFRKLAVGGVVNNLNSSIVRNVVVPIPPLAEQERIVAELDLLSGIIEKKKEQLKAYDQLAQSVFYTMFGDPVTNEKGWDVIQLGSKCEVSSFKRVLIEDVVDKGIPFIRGTELMSLSKGEKTPFTLFITPEHYEKVKAISGVPKIGDLLIPSINANGSIWVLNTEEPRYYKDGRVLWVHVDNNTYTSQALKYIMHNLIMSNYSSVASGATFAELKLFVLRELNTIQPPLSLQQEFAEKVEAIERQKALVQQSIEETQTMFDFTMDKYFG